MGRHLVLAGGGHAHLTTMAGTGDFISRGHQVTVIGPDPYHYYSGMAPGALAGTYRPEEIRFDIRKLVTDRGGRFIQDKVVEVDPHRGELILESGGSVPYDVVSFNLGSLVPSDTINAAGGSVFPVKPIQNIIRARQAILDMLAELRPVHVQVVGGGPAGVEIALAAAALGAGSAGRISVGLITGGRLLPALPARAVDMAAKAMADHGISVREGVRVSGVTDGALELADGSALEADVIFLALGVKPAPLFLNSLVPTGEDGGLLVDNYLRSVEFDNIFGGGDCITIRGQKLDRVGVYAVRQNPVLAHNLLAALEGTPLREFYPGSPNYLQILNMSDGSAILRKGDLVRQGKTAFRVKDWIDRRFMRKYQLSGELDE